MVSLRSKEEGILGVRNVTGDPRKRVWERGEGKMEGFKGQTQNLSNVSQDQRVPVRSASKRWHFPMLSVALQIPRFRESEHEASERNSRDW